MPLDRSSDKFVVQKNLSELRSKGTVQAEYNKIIWVCKFLNAKILILAEYSSTHLVVNLMREMRRQQTHQVHN